LRAPHVSEKESTAMEKTNTIVLKVAKDATKAEIKAAVQKLFEGDNQQERFASYLIAAVQQATGGHCAASEAMVQKRQYASLPS
uniref:50S ribosomal protein L23 n=1 Tax=Klebsiella michiganensis TaxID=1134687 RepID=UPI001D190161